MNEQRIHIPTTSLENTLLPRNAAEAAELERTFVRFPPTDPSQVELGSLPLPFSATNDVAADTAGTVTGTDEFLPDLEQACRFLEILDPSGVYTFQTFADRKELKQLFTGRDGKQRPWDPFAEVFHGTLDEHAVELGARNQLGAGVFVMVNEGDGHGRETENVIRVRAHFVDLDGAPLDPVLSAGATPHIIVESSNHKWHVYWLTDNCQLGDFTLGQQMLAAKFNGDPTVCDLPRVLRLPGFYHQKTNTPFMTRLVDGTKG